MLLGKAIFAQLSAAVPVNTLIATRIYPILSPEKGRVFPECVYDGDDEESDQTFFGPSGLVKQMVTIHCRDRTYAGMDALATAVQIALDGESGTWGGIVVQGCFFRGRLERDEPLPGTGPDSVVYVKELTFLVWFVQPS